MAKPVKAVIFDCFGVLLHTAFSERFAELEAVEPAKAQDLRAVYHAADRGILSTEDVVESAANLLGMEPHEYRDVQARGETRNQPLIDFIQTLKPYYKVGMLSNVSGRDRIEARFELGQLDTLFDTVVVSGAEGFVKPQPEVYEIAAARLGVSPSECVMVDDVEAFCCGAEEVGMRAVQKY